MPGIVAFNNNHIIARADPAVDYLDIQGLTPKADEMKNFTAPLTWFKGDCKKIIAYYVDGSSAQEISWEHTGDKVTLPHNANIFVSEGGLNSSSLRIVDCANNVLAEFTPVGR